MPVDYLEFKMRPIHWILPFFLAVPTGLFSLSLFITMLASGESVHGITAAAVLFLSGANIYAGIRNKSNATVLITKQALHIGTVTIQLQDIKHVEFNTPQKIILWLVAGKSEYRKTLNVNAIVPEQQMQFREAISNLNYQNQRKMNTTA